MHQAPALGARVCLADESASSLPGLDLTDDKVVIDGVIRHVDLLLRDHRVIIEVDGRDRHDGEVEHDRDAGKSALLEAAGYRVLRVRGAPLRPVTVNDVVVPTDATVKQTADATLCRLLELGWVPLDGAAVSAYLAEPEPRHHDQALRDCRPTGPARSSSCRDRWPSRGRNGGTKGCGC